jgi:hypothetical protein
MSAGYTLRTMFSRYVTSFLNSIAICGYASGCAIKPPYFDHPLAPAAVSRMVSDDTVLAEEGTVEVRSLGATAMPELIRQFAHAAPETRLRILDIALDIHEPEELIGNLFRLAAEDSVAAVRRHAAARAARLPQLSVTLTPILLDQLRDSVAEVRAAALNTLGGFSPSEALSPELLLTLLDDQQLVVVATASTLALQRREPYLKAAARAALPRLIGGLYEKHPATRAAVLFAIGQFGLAAAPAVTPVKAVVANDPVAEVRLQAALTLQHIATPAARDASQAALTALAEDASPVISAAARAALAENPGD